MGKVHLIETEIEGLFIIEPTVFNDYRGHLTEIYNKRDFDEIGITKDFLQDNMIVSKKKVLRGLHFQHSYPQTKLISAIQGEVFDVAVDLRYKSKTFGKWFGINLSEDSNRMFYVPEGFAHGFLVLSQSAVVHYKCSEYYHPEDQFGLIWSDPDVNILWPLNKDEIILSERDKNWRRLQDMKEI